jgi:predicted O-linked N-acetylglucosamine transferase (SPINDLY family)
MANAETVEQRLVAGWQALERSDPGAAEAIAREVLRQGSHRQGPLGVIAYNLLGVSLMQQSRHEEALDVLGSALVREPHSAGTHLNVGSALLHLGRHGQAIAHFRKAAELEPQLSQAHNNLAHSLKELGRLDEAVIAYRAALALDPGFVPAHVNLGLALRAQGLVEEAEESFLIAIERDPGCAEAHAQLGMVRRAQGRLPEALAHLEKALSIEGEHVPALVHLGAAYQEQGRSAEAATCLRRAIALDPGSADALHNLGIALQALSRHDEAISCFREVLRIAPRHKYTLGSLVWGELQTHRWERRDADAAELSAAIREGVAVIEPFALIAVSEDLGEQRRCAEIFHGDRVKKREPVWKGERYRHDKIRVAYVSADFCDHATAQLMAGLFELHDRSRFDIISASLGADDGSAIRARLVRSFDRFFDLRSLGDLDAAKLLHEAEVDIAVDLKGYTQESRPGIFAHRPAQIQVGYLGFPGTVGADFLDYILADRFVLPETHQRFFTEKVAYLPDSYQVNDRERAIADATPSRAELELPDDGFVFCCFNNSYKITPDMFSLWMRLLQQVPGSVLWLLGDKEGASRNLEKEARARDLEPGRLVFAPRISADRHLARQRRADLFLDTLPYNAHTTASDALWAGLPMITCPGRSFAARVAGSLLHSLGLPELVARDLAEYEATALRLARNPSELAEIRAKLARNRSSAPLFDTDRFRRHIEAAYTTMWEIAQRGEAPRSFSVPAIG